MVLELGKKLKINLGKESNNISIQSAVKWVISVIELLQRLREIFK